MQIAARVSNTPSGHDVEVETDSRKQSIEISPKSTGRGSGVNGGELLFAALATCFCSDIYREATKRGIDIHDVKVEVTGRFGNPGEPARDISYRVKVNGNAPQNAIDDLIRATDSVTGYRTRSVPAAKFDWSWADVISQLTKKSLFHSYEIGH
jgi:uncharacterized OsmC-like protein